MKYEKFCEWQELSVEAKEEGIYDCFAHLHEARCFPCPYKSIASTYPCSDYKLFKHNESYKMNQLTKQQFIQKLDGLVQYYKPWENDGGPSREEYISKLVDQLLEQQDKKYAKSKSMEFYDWYSKYDGNIRILTDAYDQMEKEKKKLNTPS